MREMNLFDGSAKESSTEAKCLAGVLNERGV